MGLTIFAALLETQHPNWTSTTIICFSGNSIIKALGQTIIDCHRKNGMYKLLFQIVQHDHQPFLSATAL
jgi:hypothetical protein